MTTFLSFLLDKNPPRAVHIRDLIVETVLSTKEGKLSPSVLECLMDAYLQAIDDGVMASREEKVVCAKGKNAIEAVFQEAVLEAYRNTFPDTPDDWRDIPDLPPGICSHGEQLIPRGFLEYLGTMVGYRAAQYELLRREGENNGK